MTAINGGKPVRLSAVRELGPDFSRQGIKVRYCCLSSLHRISIARRSVLVDLRLMHSHMRWDPVEGHSPKGCSVFKLLQYWPMGSPHTETGDALKRTADENFEAASLSKENEDNKKNGTTFVDSGDVDSQAFEREEGEWSDGDSYADAHGNSSQHETPVGCHEASREQGMAGGIDHSASGPSVEKTSSNVSTVEVHKIENSSSPSRLNRDLHDLECSSSQNFDASAEGNIFIDGQKDPQLVPKRKEVKGVEASYALKCANNIGKKHKIDQHKEAMLGKKRGRQTMFLNLEDVKQASAVKSLTPRRQTIATPNTKGGRNFRSPAEHNREKTNGPTSKDQSQVNLSCNEERGFMDTSDHKSECNSNADELARPKRSNISHELSAEVVPPCFLMHNLSKQPVDSGMLLTSQVPLGMLASVSHGSMDLNSGGNKKNPPKKQTVISSQCQDTSVERLLREVTSEKFWHPSEETELQRVPGWFESVEEYVRVFEPLLFEECRAQLYSTWEELTEAASRDVHVMVRIKCVERRERGWYDAIVLPAKEIKWTFKEGDVAVLSTPRPGSAARPRRNDNSSIEDDHKEPEVTARVMGTVRRHTPIDTRNPQGAILLFFVGDSFDTNSNNGNDHIIRKLQPRGLWFLTVLGSLATTQREYLALHAFRHLNVQIQSAILQPSPEHFPKYEEQTPAMPECFTPKFFEYLNRTFNAPQLAAIHWAAMHTASGTSGGMTRRQDPWPFTLVQGPPGTGKTHMVWGMLNVIHLVQYQHYYAALLKKLAPERYKQNNKSGNAENIASGSIDEVLQTMDQDLFRTLPKLYPKPKMLVCAPSNAATDEMLIRVLDRGFIDGEMKVYRPDVARVGVDSQSRAAQAVSVERRTEQLLLKSREEIYGWLQQLKGRETHLSHQMASLQRQLNIAAAAERSQGSVSVDPDILVTCDQNRDALLQNLASVVEDRDKVLVEMYRLLILEGKFRASSGFNLEEARASLEASFANEAEIVFTTLSSSGRKLFSRLTHGFDIVVIDEAAQASEVALLPPFCLGAARYVLVGDPQQLPATVISKAAGTLLYSRSLFERFQQAGCPTFLLSVQYRMHPQIRDFPSRYFYQGRLIDSESVVSLPDERYYQDPLLRPYVFYDIMHGRESHRGGSVSYQNAQEAQFCRRLYEHLQKIIKSLALGKVSVGIITPYKLQLKCIQREFEDLLNSEDGRDLYINTVDAFQGQERDVIIMSCVRASIHGVGFVADIRRMNVALTRARRALWVMGNANALIKSEDWGALIADAKARNCYMDMESLPKGFLVPKGPAYASFPAKFPFGMRDFRSGGPRQRSLLNMAIEPKLGIPSEENKPSVICHEKNNCSAPNITMLKFDRVLKIQASCGFEPMPSRGLSQDLGFLSNKDCLEKQIHFRKLLQTLKELTVVQLHLEDSSDPTHDMLFLVHPFSKVKLV
ncbi:hypothetical protein Nepgr_022459 [Nepenthes gracilis]|uniref:Uncharacterized protein n=1 Tax=Nepenthes gracilis TaxID=150966 RepID=A0AAD3T0C9_NEPGR|nr:hypothetical protein Nepgr_022459 [Nepenthes gracilis]